MYIVHVTNCEEQRVLCNGVLQTPLLLRESHITTGAYLSQKKIISMFIFEANYIPVLLGVSVLVINTQN